MQKNTWVVNNTLIKWPNIIWFKIYPFRTKKNSILFFDKVPSHINDEVIEMLHNDECSYRLIPPGLTSFYQP